MAGMCVGNKRETNIFLSSRSEIPNIGDVGEGMHHPNLKLILLIARLKKKNKHEI